MKRDVTNDDAVSGPASNGIGTNEQPGLPRGGSLPGSGPREVDDREGLDLLAGAIEAVAEDLPVPPMGPALDAVDRERALSSTPPRPFLGLSSPSSAAALAAGLATLVLAFPAYLGLVRLPEAESHLASLGSAPAGLGETMDGPVEMVWLSPPREGARSETAVPEMVERRDGGLSVWLLEVPMSARDSLAAGARIELLDESGRSVRSWPLSAQSVERQLATNDGIPLALDSSHLTPGLYRLRIWPASSDIDVGTSPGHGAPAVDMALELMDGPAELLP